MAKNRLINDLGTVWSLTRAFTKRYFRDKIALFFTFAFPLIFLMIFGTIFGGNAGPSFKVALINKSKTEFAAKFVEQTRQGKVFTFTDTNDFDEAKEKLGRGEFDAILELPEGFGVLDEKQRPSGILIEYYDKSDEQLNSALTAVLQGILDNINSQFVQVDEPLKLEPKPIQTSNLSRFDYTLAGLIGFSMIGLGIFSMSEGFTGDKKAGALRRIQVSPIRAWQLIIATALNRIMVGLISVGLLFIAALLIFDFNMRGDYLSFALFTVIGTACMFGFGMAIAGWAKDANQAAPLTQIITLPMMFLSGVFFPTFLMPDWLQKITAFIPLTPIIDGLRLILTEGKTVLELGPQLAIVGSWIVIIYLIAFRVFRWE
jgi:ABC-2 type transport system permease protein